MKNKSDKLYTINLIIDGLIFFFFALYKFKNENINIIGMLVICGIMTVKYPVWDIISLHKVLRSA